MDLLDPAKGHQVQAAMGAVGAEDAGGAWNPLKARPMTGRLTEKLMNEWPCRCCS